MDNLKLIFNYISDNKWDNVKNIITKEKKYRL